MKPQPMLRRGDCVATAIAAMLDIDVLDLPHTGHEDHETAWRFLRSALWERGWRITYHEWEPTDLLMLTDVLALYNRTADSYDTIEADMLWIVSVTHPSFVMDGEQVNHAILVKGNRIVFYPEPANPEPRPPVSELVMRGSFMLAPIDPAAFTFKRKDHDETA